MEIKIKTRDVRPKPRCQINTKFKYLSGTLNTKVYPLHKEKQ